MPTDPGQGVQRRPRTGRPGPARAAASPVPSGAADLVIERHTDRPRCRGLASRSGAWRAWPVSGDRDGASISQRRGRRAGSGTGRRSGSNAREPGKGWTGRPSTGQATPGIMVTGGAPDRPDHGRPRGLVRPAIVRDGSACQSRRTAAPGTIGPTSRRSPAGLAASPIPDPLVPRFQPPDRSRFRPGPAKRNRSQPPVLPFVRALPSCSLAALPPATPRSQ
jgi:hypothetical protein